MHVWQCISIWGAEADVLVQVLQLKLMVQSLM